MHEDALNNEHPEDGFYFAGAYLIGCKWNETNKCLDECDPKVPYVKTPVILFKIEPKQTSANIEKRRLRKM